MQESDRVNSFDSSQQLPTQADCCADGEATFGLAAPKFSQIAALKIHHHIVELLIASTADESTNMILTCNNKQVPLMSQRGHAMLRVCQ